VDKNALNRDGEWLELEIDSDKIDKLRFKVRPISAHDEVQAVESGRNIIRNVYKTIVDIVIDWDMTDGDEPYPCTPEHKEELMPFLVNFPVKGKKDSVVGGAILEFAKNTSNFLKN